MSADTPFAEKVRKARLAGPRGTASAAWLWAVCSMVLPAAAAEPPIRMEHAGATALYESVVSAEVPGSLVRLHVREGQHVTAGELLAQVDDAESRLEVDSAGIELRTAQERAGDDSGVQLAQAELDLAQADLRRSSESNSQIPNSVTAARLEQLRLTVERERFKLAQAQQELRIARIGLDSAANRLTHAKQSAERHQIRAPIEGTVVAILRRKGEWVQTGTPVVRILQTKVLRVEAFAAASVVEKIVVESEASFETRSGSTGVRQYAGKITFVSPEANPVNGQVRVVAEVENRQMSLRSGTLGTLIVKQGGGQSVFSPPSPSPSARPLPEGEVTSSRSGEAELEPLSRR